MNLLPLIGASAISCLALVQPPSVNGTAARVANAPPSLDGRVPIHQIPADDVGERCGWWAAAATYQVSFHDGFVFHPVVGGDCAEDLSLRWTTESITCGGASILDLARPPVHHHTQWRYEYHHDGMTEAYDVRAEGVEQSFVIHARPRAKGDLRVTGRLTTRLTPTVVASAAAAHGPLTLRDERGQAVVRYGEAFAIDAAGRRIDVSTACDGERVELTVPGFWLEDATFPLTIDPLTSRVLLATSGLFNTIWGTMNADMACDEESATKNLMFVVTHPVSATNAIIYAVLCNDDFSNPQTVFIDSAASLARRPKVAFVAGADRWVIAYEKSEFALGTGIAVYFHDKGNTTQNSGLSVFRAAPAGTTDWFLDIGGTAANSAGDNALLVYQSEVGTTMTTNSIVWGTLVDARARTLGNAFRISSAVGNLDSQRAAVNQVTDGGTASWIVVYEQKDNAISNDDYDVLAARITAAGTIAGTAQVGPDGGPPLHKIFADVAGRGGRYMVSIYQSDEAPGGSYQLVVERFDWSEGATAPTRSGSKIVVAAANQPGPGQLAFDGLTRSHWALLYPQGIGAQPPGPPQLYVRRLGSSGGTTEVVRADTSPDTPGLTTTPAGITFVPRRQEFAFEHLLRSASGVNISFVLYGQRLQYPADAITVLYGTACGTGVISAPRPFAGDAFFTLSMTGRPAGTACALFLGFAPATIPLDALGMFGCVFNLDPAQLLTNIGTTVNGSAARVSFRLPDDPLFLGDVFAQWVFAQPGLNAANLGTTQGARIQVR